MGITFHHYMPVSVSRKEVRLTANKNSTFTAKTSYALSASAMHDLNTRPEGIQYGPTPPAVAVGLMANSWRRTNKRLWAAINPDVRHGLQLHGTTY